jgi:hypothetical protein
MNDDPAKHAWQASVEIGRALPLEDVRRGANKFYHYVWWRNAVEYAAAVIVVASFVYSAITIPSPLIKGGSVLVIGAALFAVWQLYRRASAEPPERAGTMPLLAFTRAQLLRQRDALRSIFWWYMLPFLPGMALIVIGAMLSRGGPQLRDAIGMAVLVAVFAGVWWINQLAARKLQRHIGEIDELMGGERG